MSAGDDDDVDDADGEYDSGPFCRHWTDPLDCEERCTGCGHRCGNHDSLGDLTQCDECDCTEWQEKEEE